jgi:hypothetical protein
MSMLVAFEIDCGEVLAGHRFLAKGLRYDGNSDDRVLSDYSEHAPGKPVHRMVSLTYSLVPGLSIDELRAGLSIDARITLEPPADSDYWDAVLSPGGEHDATPGTDATNGAIGPFVLPTATRRVTIELVELSLSRASESRSREDDDERIAGHLEIDVPAGMASWTPV